MKELGRGTAYNTHNITSLIRTPQVCIRHLADGRSLHGGTHTHTHTRTYTHVFSYLSLTFQKNIKMFGYLSLGDQLIFCNFKENRQNCSDGV